MPEIEVAFEAVRQIEQELGAVEGAIGLLAAELRHAEPAGEATGFPDSAAAFDGMLSAWVRSLSDLSQAVAGAGRAAAGAAVAYEMVEEANTPADR